MRLLAWTTALGTIVGVLKVLVLLAGLIITAWIYFQKKNTIAMLGALGFLLLFLFNCCSLGWSFADRPILKELPRNSIQSYLTTKSVVLFLAGLVSLAGFGLIISALWTGGRQE